MTFKQAIATADRDLDRALPGYHVKAADDTCRTAHVMGPISKGPLFTKTTAEIVWWVKGACATVEILHDNPDACLPNWAQDHNATVATDLQTQQAGA